MINESMIFFNKYLLCFYSKNPDGAKSNKSQKSFFALTKNL